MTTLSISPQIGSSGGRRRLAAGALSTLISGWALVLLTSAAVADQPHVRRLGVEEGLAQSSVHGLAQDHLGFIWIGTHDGLQRYDGYGFVHFVADPFRADSLSHSMVASLLEDHDGRLWVGTARGLNRLDLRALGFEPLVDTPLAEAASWPVSALAEDGEGRLWVAIRDGGIAVLSAARDEVRRLEVANGELPSNRVRALGTGPAGQVWIGFADAPPGRFGNDGYEPLAGLGSNDVRAIAAHGESLWLATATGVVRLGIASLDPPSPELEIFSHDPARPSSLSDDDVTALLVDRRGRLWAGGRRGLDLHLGGGEFRHFRHRAGDASSFGHNHVEVLLEDAGGLIWAGTALGGVSVIDTRPRFTHVRSDPDGTGGLPSDVVRAMVEDPSGDLWLGTDGGGLARRRQDGSFEGVELGLERPAAAESRIWSLHLDRSGQDLWVGGQQALHRVALAGPSRTEVYRHDADDPDSLGPGAIRALSQDSDGRLWIGLFGGGLSRLDPGERRFEHFRQQAGRPFTLPSDLVLSLYRDQRASLWIGTAAGLARLTADGRFHSYHHDAEDRTSLFGDLVRAITQDAAGDLWVGTDAGLNRLPAAVVASPPIAAPNNRGFIHLSELDGLADNTVHAILEDGEGRLWLSSNRGLSRFDPAGRTFTHFDLSDELQGLEFNTGAAFKGADGVLYFGGLGGYNAFRPSAIEVNDHVPPVRFTAMTILDASGEPRRRTWTGGELVLGHDDVAATVEFAALDYSHSAANRYSYRLEGRDEGWQDLGAGHSLTLTGLAAGDYRLQVRGANDDGVWNTAGASLLIRVSPSPWGTVWAYQLYAALALGLIGLLAVRRNRRRDLRRRMGEVVRTSERRLGLALKGSGDGLWDWDLETGEVFRSGIAEMLGFEAEDLPGDLSWRHAWIFPEDRQRVEDAVEAHLRGETRRFEADYRVRDSSGRQRWILDRGNVVERDSEGKPRRMAGTFKDMTAHKETERELRLWSTVFEAIDEGVVVLDADGRVQAVNEAFCRLFGRPRHSLTGRPSSRLQSPTHDEAFYRRLRRQLVVRGSWRGEIRMPRSDGGERLVWVEMRAVEEPSDELLLQPANRRGELAPSSAPERPKSRYVEPSHYVAVISDITRRKRAEEELRYLADYDPLTGLPNRAMFSREAAKAVADAEAQDRGVALLFGDLDQFKQINDTLGHSAGDQLLQEVARRLLTSVRTEDLVARLGGDELVVLLHDPSGKGVIDHDSVTLVARRILDSFAPGVEIEGQELSVSASLGIAIFPQDGGDIEALLKHADTAMYEAKAQGRSRYCFYTKDMSDRALIRMTLDHRLRQALADESFEVHYQPIFDVQRGEVTGVEALLRWPQPDGEVWAPEAFLEIAEETGLIVPLGTWVLRRACQQAVVWRKAGRRLDLSVNLSRAQLEQDDVVAEVEKALEESGFEAAGLSLEISESVVMDRGEDRLRRLERLRGLGLRLSIDDFGTGFSSLGHLQRLAFDELKIDNSFVHSITDKESSPIARTILAMAEGMEVAVVAEGVETEEQLEILSRLGCRRVQGYLVSRPLPAAELDKLMSSTEAPWRRLELIRRRRISRRLAKGNLRPVE